MQTSVIKKTLLLSLLLVASGTACAEWLKFGATEAGATFYMDPATIRVNGNLRKAWVVMNYAQREKSGGASMRYQYEFDCKEETSKSTPPTEHSELLAGGTVLFTSDRGTNWTPVPPGSVTAAAMSILCAH